MMCRLTNYSLKNICSLLASMRRCSDPIPGLFIALWRYLAVFMQNRSCTFFALFLICTFYPQFRLFLCSV